MRKRIRMNQVIEVKHRHEIECVALSGDCMERRVVKADHQGLEYQAKCFDLYSIGNRELLKDYEWKNEMFRSFLVLFLIWWSE